LPGALQASVIRKAIPMITATVPTGSGSRKKEAGDGALHAAVVKVLAGRREAPSNLPEPSG
jgi:hypothetical protein